jgi:antitoxin VapB
MRAKKTAKVFWTGRSQAVRLPKEFRFDSETVSVRREGQAVILEPTDEWPEGYVESFTGVPHDFSRPPQRKVEKRAALR